MATIHVVEARNFFYSPANISVNTGDTVRFQRIEGSHPTSSTSGDWTSFVFFPLNASEPTFDLVFDNPGTYNYQCDFHAAVGMIGSITVLGSPSCSTASPPTGQSSTNLSNRVQLNWTPQAGAVACQVQGKRLPSGPQPTQNVLPPMVNTTNVPYSVAGAGTTWTWRVRCACSTSPLLVTAYSAYGDTFSIPTTKEAALAEGKALLFPNPASDQLMLEWSAETQEQVLIEVYDLSGRLMESRSIAQVPGVQQQFVDVSAWPRGMYFVRIGQHEVLSAEVLR